MKSLHVPFRIDFTRGVSVGPGKIELLEAVRSSGSVSQAARDIGMSYRRAWLLLESLNNSFVEPVTEARTGGRHGGGARVTEMGRTLIAAYRALEADITTLATLQLHTLRVKVSEPKKPAVKRLRRPLSRIARKPANRT
jgi:molybdate transport system regulatory protein